MFKNHISKLFSFGTDRSELDRLRQFPRFTLTETELLSKKIRLVDAASYVFIYDEIFQKEIYKFKTHSNQPYIIDCGANIGLSVIYFKQLYPNAEVVAFEPDPKVFEVLKHNSDIFGLSNVNLIPKGVWSSETTQKFFAEGADAGRIATPDDSKNIISIPTVRLRDYLMRDVDFLKIDIEGAETAVLEDCRDRLEKVKNLFVEYHSFNGQKQTVHDILRILAEAGFRYYIHHIGVFSQQPFIKRNSFINMDMQLNIYACRI